MRFILVLLLLSSCASHHEDEREHARELARLGSTASNCWNALRWKEVKSASSCYEKTSAQVSFIERWSSNASSRVTNVEILGVEVSSRKSNTAPPVLYDGTVTLSVEQITPDQVVQGSTLVQRWYRTAQGWYVEPGQEDAF